MILRPYQTALIDDARALMNQGVRSILIQAATGAGKTALTAHMLKTAASKGMKAWFVVHRIELLEQSVDAFVKVGCNVGIISSKHQSNTLLPIQVCGVQTLVNRMQSMPMPQLVVYDECHHMRAATWERVRAHTASAFTVGLTATPCRLDGKGLGTHFSTMISGPSVEWLMANGYLANYKLFAPQGFDTTGLRKSMGEYVRSETEARIDKPSIVGDVVSHYKKYAAGTQAIAFAVTVKHSKHLRDAFIAAGIIAEHLDGETPQKERYEIMARFRAGTIKVLTNVELFGEGLDVPGIQTVILARPTASFSWYRQMVGRGLRPAPGKTHAIIIDAVRNCERHGLPDDPAEFSLKDGLIKNKKEGPSVRICRNCFAANESKEKVCTQCGAPLISKDGPKREVKTVSGELTEVDLNALRMQRKKEQATAQTEADLIELGKERGYKRPHLWARHVIRARGGR